jgi:hypothetical protein
MWNSGYSGHSPLAGRRSTALIHRCLPPAPNDFDQCALVVRQISIKRRYKLSVTAAELQAMDSVLHSPVCNGDSVHLLKAKKFDAPKPKPVGEPKPKPKPTPKPKPKPEPSQPSVCRGVHQGAFCSPAGARGVTTRGTSMVCKGPHAGEVEPLPASLRPPANPFAGGLLTCFAEAPMSAHSGCM